MIVTVQLPAPLGASTRPAVHVVMPEKEKPTTVGLELSVTGTELLLTRVMVCWALDPYKIPPKSTLLGVMERVSGGAMARTWLAPEAMAKAPPGTVIACGVALHGVGVEEKSGGGQGVGSEPMAEVPSCSKLSAPQAQTVPFAVRATL